MLDAPITILALDLDGTLAVDRHEVSPQTRAALADLHDSGTEVVIATGRRYRTTTWVIENLGFDVFAVCNGGSLVKRPDRSTLHAEPLAQQRVIRMVGLARQHNMILLLQQDTKNLSGPDFVIDNHLPWNEHISRYAELNQEWAAAADLASSPDHGLLCATFDSETRTRAFAETIEREFPGEYNTIIVPDYQKRGYYCEITPIHVSKWSGLLRVASETGSAADEICAVGDQLNDMSMVTSAAHGVAMGNGVPELKAAARLVCGDHDADGLLEVVDYIRRHNSAVASRPR